jgi:hypothetical protein
LINERPAQDLRVVKKKKGDWTERVVSARVLTYPLYILLSLFAGTLSRPLVACSYASSLTRAHATHSLQDGKLKKAGPKLKPLEKKIKALNKKMK